MASDSEATESGHTRYDVDKIWTAEGLLMGFSGSVATRDLIAPSVEATFRQHFGGTTEIPRTDARTLLAQAINPVLKQAYSEVVPGPGTNYLNVAGGSLLVIGRDSGGYWLLEVDPQCVVSSYDEQGFQAIGSGGPGAHLGCRILRRFGDRRRSLAELRLIAYRTVDTCIDVLGGVVGVGGEPRLWSGEGASPFEQAAAEDIAVIKDGLEKWKTMEGEALSEVARDKPVEADDAEAMPESIEEGPKSG